MNDEIKLSTSEPMTRNASSSVGDYVCGRVIFNMQQWLGWQIGKRQENGDNDGADTLAFALGMLNKLAGDQPLCAQELAAFEQEFNGELMTLRERVRDLEPTANEAESLRERVKELEFQIERNYVSDKLATLNQAAAKFWANASRNDTETLPDTRDIITFLTGHEYSQSLAASGASIIRPGWAPTGRKSEKS